MNRIFTILLITLIITSCSEKTPVTVRHDFPTDTLNISPNFVPVDDPIPHDRELIFIESETNNSNNTITFDRQYQENVGKLPAFGIETPIARTDSVLKEKIRKKQNFYELPRNEVITSKYISLRIDNDIFTNTDYYYTHGTSISYMGLGHRFYRLLPGLGYTAQEIFGVALHQDLYTPVDPEATDLLPNDRPFAGLLYLKFIKNSLLPESGLQLKSEWIMGMIGPSALGDKIQHTIHELEPTGWAFQIKDDLLLNVNISIEKPLMRNNFLEINGEGGINLGSMKTAISASAQIKTGNLGSEYRSYATFKRTLDLNPKVYYFFFIRPSIHFVVHDATLNGGLFVRNNPHVFSYNQIEHITASINTGIGVMYKVWELRTDLTYISSVFKGGRDHRWGGIGVAYFFD